jgi:AraC family ethanolamine operon transcriptional activator
MGKNIATPISKTRMNTSANNDVVDWHLIAKQRFEDIEDLNDLVQGWDFEFHQLKSGRSAAELLQFGRPEFMLTRFYFEQPYHQRGCTALDTLTIGLIEEGIEEATTPNGALRKEDILCFPSGSELNAVSPPGFKAYSLSISEALLNEVAESCGLEVGASIGTVQQVHHCSCSEMNTLRRELRRVSSRLAQGKTAENSSEILRNLEFNLIRHLLLTISDSRPADPLKLTNRKQIVLQRARDYMEASPNKPITVLELAQASGSCVRTLEYVFNDYFGITPKAYLKSRRLVAVRHELLRSLHSKSLISEIANRWGFWHTSQFATDYRRFFGELPSETLRQRKNIRRSLLSR